MGHNISREWQLSLFMECNGICWLASSSNYPMAYNWLINWLYVRALVCATNLVPRSHLCARMSTIWFWFVNVWQQRANTINSLHTPSSCFSGIVIGHFFIFSRNPIGKKRWPMVWDVYSVVQQTEQICFYQYIFLENIGKCRIIIPGKDVNVVACNFGTYAWIFIICDRSWKSTLTICFNFC